MKSEKPKVSFIMPCYNAEKYLPTSIEAIQLQTEENWELLIIDDCSSDKSVSIASGYASDDPRIRVIRRETQSGGAYIPRKDAILMANSELVAPLDADDYIEPDYLYNLLKVMSDVGVDAVYPIMYSWDGKDLNLRHAPDLSLIGKKMVGKEAVRYTLDGWRVHCNGGIIKKEIYLRSFGMVEEDKERVRSHLDEYLTRIILYNTPTVCFTDEKYYYRENPDSITHATDIRAFGVLFHNLQLLEFAEKFYSSSSEEYLLAQRQNFHGIFDALRLKRDLSLSPEENAEVEKTLKAAKNKVDFSLLKGNVSPRYYTLLRLPEPLILIILSIVDK